MIATTCGGHSADGPAELAHHHHQRARQQAAHLRIRVLQPPGQRQLSADVQPAVHVVAHTDRFVQQVGRAGRLLLHGVHALLLGGVVGRQPAEFVDPRGQLGAIASEETNGAPELGARQQQPPRRDENRRNDQRPEGIAR